MALGDLLLRLRMDTADLESDSGRAAHIVERDMERMVARATAAGQLIGDALGKIAMRFTDLITSTINMGEQFEKAAQRTGLAVEKLSELKFAGDLADVSFGQITTSLGFFNKALAEAQNPAAKIGQIFRAMGVDINAGPTAAFEQFIKAINQLPQQEQKVAAMRAAFGRAGDALLPMIGNLEEVTDRARKLGVVMGEDLARDSARFNDAMKSLHAQSQALLIPTLTTAANGLAMIAENLVKGAEKGEKWITVFKEIGKVYLATMAQMPGPIGFIADKAATAAFATDPGGPVTGKIRRPGDETATAPNAEAVACAVSGGKWVDGKCQRGGGGRVDNSAERERARLLAADNAAVLASVEAQTAEWDKYYTMLAEKGDQEGAHFQKLSEEDVKAVLASVEAQTAEWDKYYTALAKQMTEVEKHTKKTKGFMEELGFTMISQAENAIVHWNGLRSVMQGLLADLAKVALRKGVLDPLGGAAGEWLKGIFPSGPEQLAGPRASGGPVMGGSTYLVGERGPELFTPTGSGMITPNHALGGGITQNVTVQVAAGANPNEYLAVLLPAMRQVAQGEIGRQMRPGGVFST